MCSTFNAENKYAPCISDNADLRVILSVLYTMLEVIRCYDKEVAENRLMPPPPPPPPAAAAQQQPPGTTTSSSSSASSSSSSSSLSSSLANQKDLLEKYAQMREQLKSELSKLHFSNINN